MPRPEGELSITKAGHPAVPIKAFSPLGGRGSQLFDGGCYPRFPDRSAAVSVQSGVPSRDARHRVRHSGIEIRAFEKKGRSKGVDLLFMDRDGEMKSIRLYLRRRDEFLTALGKVSAPLGNGSGP